VATICHCLSLLRRKLDKKAGVDLHFEQLGDPTCSYLDATAPKAGSLLAHLALWFPRPRTHKRTYQNTQLFSWHLPLCSKPWLHHWRTSCFLWPNYSSLQSLLYYHIRQLRCIRPYLDSSTPCTIATSIVHSKLDYSNSLYYKLPKSQLSRLQQIQNSLARTVMKAPKSCHITPILRSLHWLRITERIEYKLLSLTYKVLTTTNLPTFITASPLNVLAVLALHSSLLLLGHLHHHL